jgi:CDP-diacylglycerol---glycerol-3-phosphate 3-phosphatidyltransferase
MLKQIPNLLTCLRLLLIPLFVVLLISPTIGRVWLAFLVFVIAAGTDMLDGILARKFKAVSNFGKLVDPLADKLLVMSALVMLSSSHDSKSYLPWIPGWLVVVILAREIWITGLRSVAASQGLILAAKASGKVKSFLQMLAIAILLIPISSEGVLTEDVYRESAFKIFDQGFNLDLHLVGLLMLSISVIFSYVGAIGYTYSVLHQYSAES